MVEITESLLNIDTAYKAIADLEAGGMALFSGTVRRHNLDHTVEYLEYEAYVPMALREMGCLEEEARRQWDLLRVYMVHRIGKIALGESSVIIAVASKHRSECFAACRFLIDALKERVPVWKKEFFANGAIWLENEEGKRWITVGAKG